jgi:hypothetical protein
MWYVWRCAEVYARFRWGNLKEGDHLEVQGIGGRMTLK